MCVPRRLILRDVGHMDLHMLPRVDPRSVSGRDLKLQQIESIVHLLFGNQLQGLPPGLQKAPGAGFCGETHEDLLDGHANQPRDEHHRKLQDIACWHQFEIHQQLWHERSQPQGIFRETV